MSDPADARPTIFALSSGALPAAIAVIRISGLGAGPALERLSGKLPPPRRAVSAILRNPSGDIIDHALVLWLPGPATATGEDLTELHVHGGKAVVAAVIAELGAISGLRLAEAGEFTRRAFTNGRLDLDQIEGLADLLAAETDTQRRQAIRLAEGGLGRLVDNWRDRLLDAAARVEAAIEFAEDEDDVPQIDPAALTRIATLADEMRHALAQPPAERLRDGFRIVVAGPTNAGKSSLINVLAGREVAIASPIAGTTRDIIEAPVSIGDFPCILIDSAGLRNSAGHIERIGVARARDAILAADLILWLGDIEECPDQDRSLVVAAKADLKKRHARAGEIATSVITGQGIQDLRAAITGRLKRLLPPPDQIALNARHRDEIRATVTELEAAPLQAEPLLIAEHLRLARVALDRIAGRAGLEEMLDALFGRFCIGK